MSVDFSSLVLAPAMAVFGRPVTITPKASLPNAAPYDARGIWTITSVDIPTDAGGIMSTVSLKFGVRMADFPAALAQEDWLRTKVSDLPLGYWQGSIDPNSYLDFAIVNTTPDGQGGMVCLVKRVVR